MTPNTKDDILVEGKNGDKFDTFEKLVAPQAAPRKYEILYFNVLSFLYGHLAAFYGIYLCFTSAKLATIVFAFGMYVIGMLGITAGAHRLWSHKSYKARLPLEILLMIFNTVSFQNTATTWVRDHRMHHKYSDTDGDPHNSTRGFFFSHVGWLLVRKHEEVGRRGKTIDMTDIYNNPVLKFQKKYAVPLITLICFVIPTCIPMYFWGETLNNSWHIPTMLRYVATLNGIYLVNSAAHMWGFRPYDKNIKPSTVFSVAVVALGEGFHNYHHTFPMDYKVSEFGNYFLDFTTIFLDVCAWLGLVYDRKSMSDHSLEMRKKRTGDGSNIWGEVEEIKLK